MLGSNGITVPGLYGYVPYSVQRRKRMHIVWKAGFNTKESVTSLLALPGMAASPVASVSRSASSLGFAVDLFGRHI